MTHSYKGGSGKTLISVNLAQILSSRGKNVLLIESDLSGPVFSKNLPHLKDKHRYFNQYLKQPSQISDYIIEYDGFDLIVASPNFSYDNILKTGDYEGLLSNLNNIKRDLNSLDYDYIVFDLSPGVNYLTIAITLLCETIYIILRPDKNSFEGSRSLIEEVYSNVISKAERTFSLIVNQVPQLQEFETLLQEWDIIYKHQFPFIDNFFKIPFNPVTSLHSLDTGMILPSSDPMLVALKPIIDSLE